MWNTFSNFILSKVVFRVLYIVVGITIGLIVSLYLVENHRILTIVKVSLAPLAIFLSVMLASRQFAYTVKWNKKDTANKALREFTSKYNSIIEDLHPIINLREHIRNKKRLELCDIHNIMGVFVQSNNNDTYHFVYHGKENQDDIKQTHNHQDSCYTSRFHDNIDGMKVERSIISLLGEYEYICASIENDILNEDIVVTLLGSTIVHTYIVFQYYIYHLRFDLRHGGDRYRLYTAFEDFAKKTNKTLKLNIEILNIENIEESKYKVPFETSND